jgi:hypothetical protein
MSRFAASDNSFYLCAISGRDNGILNSVTTAANLSIARQGDLDSLDKSVM